MKKISEPQPWDRQPGENIWAFQAFCLYRDMGMTRTHEKVAIELSHKSHSMISKYSMTHNWKERIEAWTDHVDKIKQTAVLRVVEDMNKRIASHAMAIETALMSPITDFIKRLKNNQIDFNDIKENKFTSELEKRLMMVYKTAEVFAKITDTERKARGEATEIQKIDHTSNGEQIKPSINVIVAGTKSKILEEINK